MLRTPPDQFVHANRAGAEAARDAAITNVAAELAPFSANPNLAIILTVTGTNPDTTVYQVRRGNAWADVTLVVTGPRGPGPTNDQVTAGVQAGVKPYARIGGPVVPEPEIDPAIARDNEITQDFLLNILGLTAQELNDLFVGAQVSGAGAGRIITVTQADGSTVTLPVPDTGDGGGGEGGSADGVVSNVAFAADGTTLTLTLSTGGTLSASVPAALRQAGLSQSQVQALIDAAEADDVSAADVAAQISSQLASYRQLAGAVNYSVNTIVQAARRGWTYRQTGNRTVRLSLPSASGGGEVPNGWEMVAANGSSADQTVAPDGADRINGNAVLTVQAGRAVRLQKVATGVWIIIADTKDDAGAGGADATARAAAQAAQRTADSKQDALTVAQRIGFLQFGVVPSTVVGYTIAGQPADWLTDWRIWVSGGDTVGDVWMSMAIDGLPTNAAPAPTAPGADTKRHKLSATNIYNFTFANSNRTTLADGRLTRRQGRDIEIDLMFHDAASGGNLVDIVTIAVDWLGSPNPGVQVIRPAATAVVVRTDVAGVIDLNMNRAVNLNLSGGVNGDSAMVRAIQDTTGNRVLTLNATIQREGRAAPVLSTAAGKVDYLFFHRRGNAWVYLGIIKAA